VSSNSRARVISSRTRARARAPARNLRRERHSPAIFHRVRRVRRLPFAVAPLVVVAVLVFVACSSHNPPNLLLVRFDAGADATDDVDLATASFADVETNADPYLGGPCVDDGQCDDMIACTYDSCNLAVGRCRNVPDDSLCDDGVYCNGKERCVLRHGCEPGPVVTCNDGNSCDLARCVEASKSCSYSPRDVDQDGDPDQHCPGGHDCNDLDPNVSSLHPEVCANGIDDNCNGLIDEMPCVSAKGTTCSTAVAATGAGTYSLSTLGSSKTIPMSCSVSNPSAGQSAAAAITVPKGPNVDLDVWATTTSVEVSVALQGACGDTITELSCGSGKDATSVRARARNVPPGTYYAVVTTQAPSGVELDVSLLAPTPPATNVDCATAIPIQPSTPTTVSILDATTHFLTSACPSTAQMLTYSLSLAQAQDVRIYASTVRGSGSPVVGIRDPTCSAASDELSCRSDSASPVFKRNLPPGSYVVTVGASAPIDTSVTVELSAPSATPPDQSCTSPPTISKNGTAAFDLSNHEDAIKDGCFPGAPDAAYDLTLPVASDVLLVERIPESEQGAVALDGLGCSKSIACTSGSTPVRARKRNVAAGFYRLVVTDQLGLQGTVDALVRPTVAPTILPAGAADTCATAVDASAGGFFTGDTSTAKPDFSNPCDAPTSPPGGAPDQVLSLSLPQPQRVVLDMEGSSYTTILDVRQGPSCPGTPVMNGCYVGFGPQKSFLDLELEAGTYWIIIDGYTLSKGAWELDVRVLPP
jgi:hypothetical protein